MEEWKDIPDWEGYYQASTEGQIRSLDRIIITRKGKRKLNGRILKPSLMNSGYLSLSLAREGKLHSRTVHGLIADAFFGERIKGIDVDHINCDRTDNRLCNLRILSHKENSNRALEYKVEYDRHLEKNPKARKVIAILFDKVEKVYGCGKSLCLELGMNYSTFKYKMRTGGITINNIHYKYECYY